MPSTPSTTSTTSTNPTPSATSTTSISPIRPGIDYLVKGLLSKERKPFQSIGRGLHNGVFYIGTVLDQENKQIDAVITSDRRIFVNWSGKDTINEIKTYFGLNYRFPLFGDCTDYWWSNNSILKWLDEGYIVSIKTLFEKIVEINKVYMIYEDERVHFYTALDIMRSYFFPLFPANNRTYHHADPDSGKTNQLMIYRALCFNPISSSDFSSASIYRIIESTQGTILIDDFDNLPEEQKLAIIQHIRTNYKRFKTIRADGNRKNRPYGYNSFSHLVFNNALGLGHDDITPQRCITIRLLKHKDAKDKTVNSDDLIFSAIRDDLHVMTLQYFQEVKACYDSLIVEDLATRELENIKPILAIAKIIDPAIYESIFLWYRDYLKQEKLKDVFNDWEFLLLTALWNHVKNENNDKSLIQVFVKNIAEDLAESLTGKDEKDYKKTLHRLYAFVGGRIKSYVLFKGGQTNGRTRYGIYKSGIKQIIELRGLVEAVEAVEGRGSVEDHNVQKTLVQQQEKPFLVKKRDISEIENVMLTKPRHDWAINDICFNLDIADISGRQEISGILEKITSDPKNPTRIRRADDFGLYWRLIEVDQ